MSQAEKLSITSISINTKNGYKHKSVLLIKGYTSPDIWGEVYRVLPHKLLLTTYYPDQFFLIFLLRISVAILNDILQVGFFVSISVVNNQLLNGSILKWVSLSLYTCFFIVHWYVSMHVLIKHTFLYFDYDMFNHLHCLQKNTLSITYMFPFATHICL